VVPPAPDDLEWIQPPSDAEPPQWPQPGPDSRVPQEAGSLLWPVPERQARPTKKPVFADPEDAPPIARPPQTAAQPGAVPAPGAPSQAVPHAAAVAVAWAPEAGAPEYQSVLAQGEAIAPAQAQGAAEAEVAPDPTVTPPSPAAEAAAGTARTASGILVDAYGPGGFGSLVAPVPAEAAAYAAEATSAGEDEDMGWEEPPEIGPDGRGPWLDGPDAPWGSAPSAAGRRGLIAGAWGIGLGLAAAAVKLFLLT
jgi:hypothetical protein